MSAWRPEFALDRSERGDTARADVPENLDIARCQRNLVFHFYPPINGYCAQTALRVWAARGCEAGEAYAWSRSSQIVAGGMPGTDAST